MEEELAFLDADMDALQQCISPASAQLGGGALGYPEGSDQGRLERY